jgi:hypothetical protein
MFPATVHLKEAISLALSGKLEDVWKDSVTYLSVEMLAKCTHSQPLTCVLM